MKLIRTTSIGGDETAGYDVILDKFYTVSEFIQEVLNNEGEWGVIHINGFDSCEYRYGKLLSNLDTNLMTDIVKKVTSRGGWSLMDYYVTI